MDENKKSTKRFLVIYSIAIFVFAVALILIASLSQMRINREADEIKARLTNAEILAADKQTRLDAVMTENSRLNEQIKRLQAENDTLKTENGTLTLAKDTDAKRIAAYQKLAEMINYKRLGKTRSLKNAIEAFEAGKYPECLNVADLEIYNSIK